MEPGVIVAIALPALMQTGALIYFAATIATTQKEHERRITENEGLTKVLATDVAYLKGKEGL
jgi:hypothetical protein